MKQRYMKLVRRAYRYLRHRRIRRNKFLNALTLKLVDRDLLNPTTHTVALGLSIGLFCSMLPMPFQMVLAGAICMVIRANIPVALAACWVSNPITQIPLMVGQESLGSWLRGLLNIPLPSFLTEDLSWTIFGAELSAGNFLIGVAASACTLALVTYPLVMGISIFVPKGSDPLRETSD